MSRRLFLSFTGLWKYWREGEVDFDVDLFYFGCGQPHVLGEIGDAEGTPWSEWIDWFKVDPETCRELRLQLVKAFEEDRVDFAYDRSARSSYDLLKRMLKKQGIVAPEPDPRWLMEHHNYPQVTKWLEGTIECCY